MSTKIHPFEKAGLGQSPFRCVGMHIKQGPIKRGSVEIGYPGQPMGSCDFCGNGIKYVYEIVSSDGHEFGVGCDCVQKTSGMGYDRKLVETVKNIKRDNDRKIRESRKTEKEQTRKALADIKATDFLSDNPELVKAFEVDHDIIRNIKSNLDHWGSISENQIALVYKIADQIHERENQTFVNVPVESGRQTITGKVVSAKWVYSGPDWCLISALKAMIIVDTPEGQWKTWGSIPSSIVDQFSNDTAEAIKGQTIQFDAKVKVAPNDSTMSFFSRPSKGSIVEDK